MGYQVERLKTVSGIGVDEQELRRGIARLLGTDGARFARLWAYYRNPMRICGTRGSASNGDRPYRQGQEWGMPMRITGRRSACDIAGGDAADEVARKEVVVENDIGWRIDTMVDYLFGKPLVIRSAAPDAKRREVIDQLVRAIVA